MSFDIKGKVALVTGAAAGIGLAYVEALLENGIKGVCMLDMNQEVLLEESTRLLKLYSNSAEILCIVYDLSDTQNIESIFRKTIDKFRNLDIVINNAGIENENLVDRSINVNLTAVIKSTLLAFDKYLPKYKSGVEGLVINTSSVHALLAFSMTPTYCGVKSGVLYFARCLGHANHYRRTNVRIITICPGGTETDMVNNFVLKEEYVDCCDDDLPTVTFQSTQAVGNALIEIIKRGKTGSAWIVNKGKFEEVEFPELFKQSNL